ncbi:hypothetical protein ASG88_09405 [Nocardioides sp. Soil777]|nr:hypothetical protein ASG88_09405 [Nocardioides sp. Soil777]
MVPLLGAALLTCLLGSCATEPTSGTPAAPSEGTTARASTPPTEPTATPSTRGFQVVSDAESPADEDLQRLAERFVEYAVGETDSFPHTWTISLSIGGRASGSIEVTDAALADRSTWEGCPDGSTTSGASSCPVDILGPIEAAVVNETTIVHTAEYGAVSCAPTRRGPLPDGRLVVLRPSPEWRTCATDFALVLAADEQGRLRSVDLTLSSP